ncbi:glycosyl transferase family 1 [Aureimonas mangrovi]|uniref:glycosyl transferase family 1 n=1 Tax=Aureimonas mangrovi TaxID=2758041 RepID=UPI00163D45B8|nr:glycosyl transferase family 1 [Aureimonas mangrovi]
MTTILYLVHDLGDAAVEKRVAMLQAGGARVALAGFRRGEAPPDAIRGVVPVDLGRTYDGDFRQRIAKLASALVSRQKGALAALNPDVVVARNLEMLALARSLPFAAPAQPRFVYETLDIHRLLLRKDAVGRAMRRLERSLLSPAALIVTSSPAFIENYLRPLQKVDAPIMLLENKVLDLSGSPAPAVARDPTSGRPLRIGWFGALRCSRSLDLLGAFSRAMEGRYEIILRGRPATREFANFEGQVAAEPFMRFEGPYRAEDLPRLYAEVDYVWAIDFFEAGLNSDWLLPNRLYEGCRHGAVPIAMAHTQTGRTLAGLGIGVLLQEAEPDHLAHRLALADPDALRDDVASLDPSLFAFDREDCRALVAALAGSGEAAVMKEAA